MTRIILIALTVLASCAGSNAQIVQAPFVDDAQITPMSTAPVCTRYGPNDKHLHNVPACKPLKCEKYQHEQRLPARCMNTCSSDGGICTSQCIYVAAEDKCVDDIHQVSERDWQNILHVLKEQNESMKILNQMVRKLGGLKESK
jgi:hypothetical protein